MRRRAFMLGAGALGLASVTGAQAQAPAHVGVLYASTAEYFHQFIPSIEQGLGEAGYVADRNLRIDYRYADGNYDRLPALAADLIAGGVEILLAVGGAAPTKAVTMAGPRLPVVFLTAVDPIRARLVPSLSRPGGHVTGVSMVAASLEGKKLEVLRELVPNGSVFGVLVNPAYPDVQVQIDSARDAAARLGLRVSVIELTKAEDVDGAFASLRAQRAAAALICIDVLLVSLGRRFAALAARDGLPVIYPQISNVVDGGLISYGPDFFDSYRQLGAYAGRILKGEKPATLPVQQPTKFLLTVNMKTAKALGLAVPPSLLARADQVIE